MSSKYWGKEGKYTTELDLITDRLIPSRGEAHNPLAEMVRNINNIMYDLYNNGLCNLDNKMSCIENLVSEVKVRNIVDTFDENGLNIFNEIDGLAEAVRAGEAMSDDDSSICGYCGGSGEVEEDLETESCSECGGSGETSGDVYSEKEENYEYQIKPAVERLFSDKSSDGIDNLIDCVVEYIKRSGDPLIEGALI